MTKVGQVKFRGMSFALNLIKSIILFEAYQGGKHVAIIVPTICLFCRKWKAG
jgi:hypothetical protein